MRPNLSFESRRSSSAAQLERLDPMSATERTPAEARADYERQMGPELGSTYGQLWQEVAWIHSKWEEYVVLFGTSPERVALLNEAAPSFCRLIQDTLWEDVLIHIGRLTDRPSTGGKGRDNLSLLALPELVDRPPTKAKVESQIGVCLASSAFARDWRNRHIAHRDLRLALGSSSLPLAAASRAMVVNALQDMTAVMNCVAKEYLDSTSFFESGPSIGGALELLYVLRDGVAARKDRLARLERGELSPSDFLGSMHEI